MAAEQKKLLRELNGTKCMCGRTKRKLQTFCAHCYARLPVELGRALYLQFGEGYEHAYERAAEFLKQAEPKPPGAKQ